jgi:hypothetical protein
MMAPTLSPLRSLLASLALAALVTAQGDWTCTSDAMCPSYAGAASNNTISATSQCVGGELGELLSL